MTTSGDVVPQALLIAREGMGYANSVPRRGENVIMERNGGWRLRILTLWRGTLQNKFFTDEKKRFLEDFQRYLIINALRFCVAFLSAYKSFFRAMVEQARGAWLSNQRGYGWASKRLLVEQASREKWGDWGIKKEKWGVWDRFQRIFRSISRGNVNKMERMGLTLVRDN